MAEQCNSCRTHDKRLRPKFPGVFLLRAADLLDEVGFTDASRQCSSCASLFFVPK